MAVGTLDKGSVAVALNSGQPGFAEKVTVLAVIGNGRPGTLHKATLAVALKQPPANVEVLLNGTTGDAQSAGAVFPASAKSTGTTGWSAAAVLSPERITADDTNYAYLTVSIFDTGDKSAILHAYSFDVSAIPSDATIVGCVVKIAAWSPVGAASIGFCNILDNSFSIVPLGDEQADPPVSLPSSIGVTTFGSESSTWGVTLTKDLFTGYFGVGFGFIADADDTDLYVDYVTMELYYIDQGFQDAYEVLMDEGQTSYHMGIGEYV